MIPTFILHRYPYRNTSWILECLTATEGRIRAVAQSARGTTSRFRGQLEPFTPFHMLFSGKSELKTLKQAELSDIPLSLNGEALWCGFYLNELLLKLLPPEDPHPHLFTHYANTLLMLTNTPIREIPLRQFEKILLETLGYAPSFTHEANQGPAIAAHLHYQYWPERGFIQQAVSENASAIPGEILLQIANNQFHEPAHFALHKHILQSILRPHLNRPLQTQQVFKPLLQVFRRVMPTVPR
ncbi:MAG: DNA repair protein RecO [Gammaproteobacteria bacterium RIFCSPHIGHO2_12_FULL_45_9]|nr:MAG: DNA repair protein RecO [Gammaproteobacteria bacterium RIFCSPHIGHO2_12_FULL_45_9]